jgi:hypothetical protein
MCQFTEVCESHHCSDICIFRGGVNTANGHSIEKMAPPHTKYSDRLTTKYSFRPPSLPVHYHSPFFSLYISSSSFLSSHISIQLILPHLSFTHLCTTYSSSSLLHTSLYNLFFLILSFTHLCTTYSSSSLASHISVQLILPHP